ncbi:MAG: hypothetical protein V7700_09370 [Halioglobus sp.]
MPAIRFPYITIAVLALLLQACATGPTTTTATEQAVAAEGQAPVPELTLNLPEQENCTCVSEQQADYTFLEKGFSALVTGDHVGAVQHFQRYQRLETSPEADWESSIAIAYDSMLPGSPFYDPVAASKSYRQLQQQQIRESEVHTTILMMRDSLATLATMELQIEKQKRDSAVLREELAKREDALKRLRDLALGQKGATP